MTTRLLTAGIALVAGLALAGSGCSDATYEPPPGCILNSEQAVEFADAFQEANGLSWGEVERVSFDGGRWRLAYATPEGETTRALIVDCATAAVTVG